jgi:hypothetical protein
MVKPDQKPPAGGFFIEVKSPTPGLTFGGKSASYAARQFASSQS